MGEAAGRRQQRLPDATDRAAALYNRGLSVTRIVAELGCSRTAVYRRLRRDQVRMRPGGPPHLPASTTEVVRRRDAGLTWAQVGDIVGMTAEGARARYLRATGARDRSRRGGSNQSLRQAQDRQWQTTWDAVLTHRDQHGSWPTRRTDLMLSRWLGEQRRQHRRGRLHPTRRQALNAGGFPLKTPEPEPLPVDELVEGYRSGDSLQTLAGRYEAAAPRIRRALIDAGEPIRGQPVTDEYLRELIGMGASEKQLAVAVGLSVEQLRRRPWLWA